MPSPDPVPTALPPLSQLHGALDALRAERRSRETVELVEAWAALAPPSPAATLRAAQALLDLGQIERAWARLQPLLDEPAPSVEVFETAAAALLARGWHDRARELLNRGLAAAPDSDALQRAWDRAAADPPPPPQPPDRDAALSPDSDIPLAEALLASGQVLSARSLLDRLARAFPADRRIQDLRWALGTNLRSASSIHDLLARALPDDRAPEELDEPENTDAITQERDASTGAAAASPSPSFPSLFRLTTPPEPDDADADAERTATSKLGFVDLPDPFEERPTEIDAGGDTRIQRVIDLKGLPAGPETAPPLAPKLTPDVAFDAALEDEDDDLVVLTHRRWTAPQPTPTYDQDPTLSEVGREVAHLLREPATRRPKPEAPPADPVDAEPSDELELTPIDTDPGPSIDAPTHRHRRPAWGTVAWLGAAGLILVVGGGAVAALALMLLWSA